MREIKFRAWWSNIGEMEYFDTVAFLNFEDGTLIYQKHPEEETCTDEISDGFELMQYTGLKDKHGREIFEGDIIYWEIDNGVGIESYTAIVKWSENLVEEGWSQTYKWLVGYTGNYYRGSYDELSTPAAYNDELQVIGNIYENPELLEESQNGTK